MSPKLATTQQPTIPHHVFQRWWLKTTGQSGSVQLYEKVLDEARSATMPFKKTFKKKFSLFLAQGVLP